MELLTMPVLIPAIIAVIFSTFLAIIFKNKPKVDKGFKLFYFRLSYRRKFFRILITLPVVLLSIFLIIHFTNLSLLGNIIVILFFVLLIGGELLYNFYMWKQKEE